MKKEDIFYTAGLIDGEGTITLTRQSKQQMRSPAVSVSSTTKELVDYMRDTHGGYVVTLGKPRKKHWKQAWHWQISHNGAIEILKSVTPYLREPKKRARAQLILKEYKSVTPRNGFYTEQLLEARQKFEELFFSL